MQQSYATSASRDLGAGAGIKSKIPLPAPHASSVTSDQGRAPPAKGPAVQGFSGSGYIKGYVK